MILDPVETLAQLIQSSSVNPMGQEISEPDQGERRLTDLLVRICDSQGWPWIRREVHPGRENLLTIVAGSPAPQDGGELLLWDVHQDTVPVAGMTVEPFGGKVADGKVYGRGASDVKGSMAAMLAALSRVSQRSIGKSEKVAGGRSRPTILLACTANEECGFTGAKTVAKLFAEGCEADAEALGVPGLFTIRPEAAIIAEPTDLNVIVAHQGVVRWRCHTLGRAAHTSRPGLGTNAIYAMASVIQSIERYHKELTASTPAHQLCGRPSACVSTIRGGISVNTVPDRATIEIDRRLGPSDRADEAYESLVRFVAEHSDIGRCEVVHDPPFMQSGGLSDKLNRSVGERLATLVHDHGRTSELIGAPYGTDAAAFSAVGIPAVVFGPGSIDQAHTKDEYIEIAELEMGAKIFERIALGGLRCPSSYG